MKLARLALAVGLTALAAGLAMLSWSLRPIDYKCRGCSLILISIDTLRADHLGGYGYAPNTTPHLDRFSKDAVQFAQAISHAPSTLPSHASLFTSLIPTHHGAFLYRQTALEPRLPTLAETLRQAGYGTASFNGGAQLSNVYGLSRGFELYDSSVQEDSARTVELAKLWLERQAGRKSFLFLHTYEVHHPYTPRPAYQAYFEPFYDGALPSWIDGELLRLSVKEHRAFEEKDRRHILSAYDAELRDVDQSLGELIHFLEQQGLYDGTLIVLLSDHGEEFGEHGAVGWHSHTLYDELLKVPLLLKLGRSKLASHVFMAQARLIDVMPTLLDILDIEAPPGLEGRSLTGLFQGPEPDAAPPAISQIDLPGHQIRSIRTERWKLASGNLYDLLTDPLETTDVAAVHRDIKKALRRQLYETIGLERPAAGQSLQPNEELVQKLKSLGYLH